MEADLIPGRRPPPKVAGFCRFNNGRDFGPSVDGRRTNSERDRHGRSGWGGGGGPQMFWTALAVGAGTELCLFAPTIAAENSGASPAAFVHAGFHLPPWAPAAARTHPSGEKTAAPNKPPADALPVELGRRRNAGGYSKIGGGRRLRVPGAKGTHSGQHAGAGGRRFPGDGPSPHFFAGGSFTRAGPKFQAASARAAGPADQP